MYQGSAEGWDSLADSRVRARYSRRVLLSFLIGSALAWQPDAVDLWSADVVRLAVGAASCSGVRLDDQGHVATAWHCVANAPRPRVETRDGQRFKARVVASAPSDDLAILLVEGLGPGGRPLRVEPVLPGQAVLAIGHPFGGEPDPAGPYEGTLSWSLAQGIVSAVGPRLVQTDAALNPGTSGGPVFDEEGAIVGIVSRKLPGEGVSFLVHVDRLRELVDEPRGAHRVGGSLALGLGMPIPMTGTGAVAFGPRVELVLRDRIVVGALFAVPLDARTTALAWGEATWATMDLSVGLRQGLGQGRSSASLELGGGLVQRMETTPRVELEAETPRIGVVHAPLPLSPSVHGRLRWQGLGLRVGWLPAEPGTVVLLTGELSWPGVRAVF